MNAVRDTAVTSARGLFSHASRGFTLIELVVVVVVLAVLATMALPKYLELRTDARVAAVRHLSGAVLSAAQNMSLRCRAIPNCGSARTHSLVLPSGTVVWMLWSYPEAGSGLSGIEQTVELSGFSVSYPSHWQTLFSRPDAPVPARCSVIYEQAGGSTNGTRDSVFTMRTDLSGC